MQYINKIKNMIIEMININQLWFKDVKTLKGIKSAYIWTFNGAGVIYSRHLWSSTQYKKYFEPQDKWTEEMCESVCLLVQVEVATTATDQEHQLQSTIMIMPTQTPFVIALQPALQSGSLYASCCQNAHDTAKHATRQ